MTVALLWLLISMSDGSRSDGITTNLGYFVKEAECEKVKAATLKLGANGGPISGYSYDAKAVCVQAEVVVVK